MRPCPLVRLGVLLPFVLAAAASTRLVAQPGPGAQGGWGDVEAALGRPGTAQPGGVVRFGFPRGDMHVSVGGVQVRQALALGS